jgi:hypothetical protein
MRATKITKYFEYENKNLLNFFPVKQKKEKTNVHLNNHTENNIHTPSSPKVHSSSFDTVNIQLETKYYSCASTIEYFIYFNNNSQLDIKGSITSVGTPLNGDLMALHEALKYIVYHPNMSQKLNKYKFNMYTNSKNICSIFKPDISIIGTNLYFKIQSLLQCIKNISIEYWGG